MEKLIAEQCSRSWVDGWFEFISRQFHFYNCDAVISQLTSQSASQPSNNYWIWMVDWWPAGHYCLVPENRIETYFLINLVQRSYAIVMLSLLFGRSSSDGIDRWMKYEMNTKLVVHMSAVYMACMKCSCSWGTEYVLEMSVWNFAIK